MGKYLVLHPPALLKLAPVAISLILSSLHSVAQSDSTRTATSLSPQNISDKSLNALQHKYGAIQKLVEGQSEKALTGMQNQEASLYVQLKQKDSAKAAQLFDNAKTKYAQLTASLKSAGGSIAGTGVNSNLFKQYFPSVDSVRTVMKYLGQASALQSAGGKLQKIQALSSKLQQLQNSLQTANLVQNFISTREQQLKSQLTRYGMAGKLIGINKQAFYYQQQMMSYKSMLDDKQKLEETMLAQAQQFPGFQSFWQKNSYLAEIFPMNSSNGVILAQSGLQQKAQLSDMVGKQISSASQSGGGGSPLAAIQSQLAQAKSKMQSLKEKVQNMDVSSGWSSNMIMPEFTPNSQHNKSFLKRLEFSFNIQNTGVTNYLPNISTLGLMLGYKISDKIMAGVGASYLVGLGNGLEQIKLSNQGVGARSFIDVKAKGSFWVTGGYEYSYMQAFARLADIRNLNVWQRSALIGITRKYMIGRKQASMQLLYNLLYKTDNPQGTPLNFRIGYSL